jgi:hypothetical protein
MLALILTGTVNTLAGNSYESEHGFKIDYPEGWYLETFMDIYKTLREAERVGGNFFQITSYPAEGARSESQHLFSRDTLRIDGWVYPGYNGTLGQLITQTKNVTKLENFTIDGKKAKKVWMKAEDSGSFGEDEVLSIYFVDEGKKVIFVCYPLYSSLMDKCDEIIGSFRFE